MKLIFWGEKPDGEAEYAAFCYDQMTPKRSDLEWQIRSDEEDLNGTEDRIASMQSNSGDSLTAETAREVGRLQVRRKQLAARLEKLRVDHSLLSEAGLRERFRSFQKIPRVVRCSFWETKGGAILTVETEPLYGKSKEGTWHRVGRVIITFDIRSCSPLDSIRYTNRDHTRKGRHAPTQNGEKGSVGCFGTAYSILYDSFRNFDHGAVIKTLVRFAESAGQHNEIVGWPCVATKDVPEWYIQTFGA